MRITEITEPNMAWQSLVDTDLHQDLMDIQQTYSSFINAWAFISKSSSLHRIHKNNLNSFIIKLEDFYKILCQFPDQADRELNEIKQTINYIKQQLIQLK